MAAQQFGVTSDGRQVERFTLQSGPLAASILTLGGVIATLEAPDRTGHVANIVLGLATVEDYELRSPHFGAIAGRYANRIRGGSFAIDGTRYELTRNEGGNTLHGGARGFARRVWNAVENAADRLALRYESAEGEEGFPGKLVVDLVYSLADGRDLRMDYRATTDRTTIVNLTNHSYFNLAGEGSGDILAHEVEIAADHFTPIDAEKIPTGEIRKVAGTVFDFTRPMPVGARIRADDEQLLLARGYDHNFVLRDAGAGLRLAARARDPASGRILEVLTDAPGLQFYTGNVLTGALVGPSGRAYRQSDGLCFETQRFPNAPNEPRFPSAVLRPGEIFASTTIFRFLTDRG